MSFPRRPFMNYEYASYTTRTELWRILAKKKTELWRGNGDTWKAQSILH
jgi:hypothetical protein